MLVVAEKGRLSAIFCHDEHFRWYFCVSWHNMLAADVVGHLGRDDHGDFHEAGYGTVNLPGGLVDHFAETVLLYGIRIGAAGLQKGTDDRL